MEARERRFALIVSTAHGADHFLKRLLPPLIPVWVIVFGFPLWKLGLLLGMLSVGSAIGTAPMGIVSDRYDRRHVLSGGLAVMGVSFVTFALAPSMGVEGVEVAVAGAAITGTFAVMLAAMFVAGLGDSVFHPAGYPLITANVSERRKGRALGMWGSASKFGDGTAPAVVGALLLLLTWDAVLLVLGLVAVGYAAYLFAVLGEFDTHPSPQGVPGGEDDPGGGVATGGGSEDSGSSGDSFDVWAADRRLYVYPMLAVFAFFAIRSVAAHGVNVFIPEFVTSVYGYSFSVLGFAVTPESTASFYFSALLIAAAVIQLGTGALVDRYDHRKVLISLLCAAAVTLAALALLSFSPVALFAVLLVLGATMWGFAPARDRLISEITPAEREGRTFGYLWASAKVIGALSPVIVGYIGDTAGLRSAFILLAVTTVLSAVPIALLLSDRVYVNASTTGDPGTG